MDYEGAPEKSKKEIFVDGMRWQLKNEKSDYAWKYRNDTLPGYARFITIYENRIHAQRDTLGKMSEDERREALGEASAVLLSSMRDMDFHISEPRALANLIKTNPQNIQYIDLLDEGCNKARFLAEIATETPEVVSFLTAEQFNEISEGSSEYILQMVRGNGELANRPPLSEIIANNPELTKEITILNKEKQLEQLKGEMIQTECELAQLKDREVKTPTVIE